MRVKTLAATALLLLAGTTILSGGQKANAGFTEASLNIDTTGREPGGSVAVSGDTLAIAASADKDMGGGSNTLYLFERKQDGWETDPQRISVGTSEGDEFGNSLAISEDIIVAGAPGDDSAGASSGAAYVFVQEAEGWRQTAALHADDGRPFDLFGQSIAVNGDTVVVGASGVSRSTGAAYVFERSSSRWEQTARLTASDGFELDFFGMAVATDGDIIAVGATGSDDSGAVYVFERVATGWVETAKLTKSDSSGGRAFGQSVSLSEGTIAAGASDGAYIFERGEQGWQRAAKLGAHSPDRSGTRVVTDGSTVVVSGSGTPGGAGIASVYIRSNDGWTRQASLKPSDATGYMLTPSVSLHQGTVVVGTPPVNGVTSPSGSIFVFQEEPADVSVEKSGSANTVTVGDELTYTIEVRNAGSSRARHIRVIDVLPVEVSVTGITTSAGECQQRGVTVRCGIGDMAPGDSAIIIIRVIADFRHNPNLPYPLDKFITNDVRVMSSGRDKDMSNNTDSEQTLVLTP